MIEIQKGARDTMRGVWVPATIDGKPTAVLHCPKCGELGFLGDHKIADDGTVTPSVICPSDSCDFHDSVKLTGWVQDGR